MPLERLHYLKLRDRIPDRHIPLPHHLVLLLVRHGIRPVVQLFVDLVRHSRRQLHLYPALARR